MEFGYHLNALRYQSKWGEARSVINSHIIKWSHAFNVQNVLLIGPSAGYLLNTNSMECFQSISAIDLDPLALFLLKMRFPKSHWHRFKVQDAIGFKKNKEFDFHTWPQTLSEFPADGILFCGVLGQVMVKNKRIASCSDRELSKIGQSLLSAIGDRAWLSWHDLTSIHPQYILDHRTRNFIPEKYERAQFEWTLSPISKFQMAIASHQHY